MNLIVLVLDSLRQDHVGLYHGSRHAFPDVPAARTPNLDAFGRDCVVLANAYPEALPTVPARYTLMIGQRALPFRPVPLQPGDPTIAQLLRNEGYAGDPWSATSTRPIPMTGAAAWRRSWPIPTESSPRTTGSRRGWWTKPWPGCGAIEGIANCSYGSTASILMNRGIPPRVIRAGRADPRGQLRILDLLCEGGL